ncbi:MAG: DegT/DnrJ/EryC1/StrS aminotransferase family protein [Coriobacteriia bacterium]|nr:DegT/DnrJ/EryC1/StrS aminotransferase family protein [Coriobacteriia bacterium]
MQFIDLKTQYLRIEDKVQKAVAQVLASQQYIMGPQVYELEDKLAAYTGVKHALSCSNGTDALVMPLMAYQLEPGDAVLVPSFTFFASAESISLAGATPVFVDSDPHTFNITAATLKEAYDKVSKEGRLNPRGIIAVDLFGLPADYEQITAFAAERGLFVIEDAAQSFGAVYQGKKAGSFGNVATTSFFPAKPLGTYGEGGAIFTNNDDFAEQLLSIRVHGQGRDKYDNIRVGINGRLDTIQAAILLEKLKIFDDEIILRGEVAAAYTQKLQDVIKTPVVPSGYQSVWAQYSLLAKNQEQREGIIEELKAKGIPTAVYYRVPIHLSAAYQQLGYLKGSLPVCEDLSTRIVSLPMHPYLSDEEIALITTEVRKALK